MLIIAVTFAFMNAKASDANASNTSVNLYDGSSMKILQEDEMVEMNKLEPFYKNGEEFTTVFDAATNSWVKISFTANNSGDKVIHVIHKYYIAGSQKITMYSIIKDGNTWTKSVQGAETACLCDLLNKAVMQKEAQ